MHSCIDTSYRAIGLYNYIADGIKLALTNSSISEMSNTTAGICKDARRQSELDVPYSGHFRKGLMYVRSLEDFSIK